MALFPPDLGEARNAGHFFRFTGTRFELAKALVNAPGDDTSILEAIGIEPKFLHLLQLLSVLSQCCECKSGCSAEIES